MDNKWYNIAIRYLAIRPRSEKEVVDYLVKKQTPEESIPQILDRLRDLQFVNDEEFVRWWIDQRTRFKPKAKRFIVLELRQKGIAKEVVDSLYSKLENAGELDFQKAMVIVEKKKIRLREFSQKEIIRKLAGLLQRRGFDYETIQRALRAHNIF